MKYRLLACSSIFVVPLLFSEARAEDLFQVYQDAQTHSLESGIQLANYHAAQALSDQARAGLNPSVELSAKASLNNQVVLDADRLSGSLAGSDNLFNHADAEYKVRWSKPLFNQREDSAIATASAEEAQANISLENQRDSLLLDVARRYFNALKAQARLNAIQQEQQYLQEQQDAARKAYDSGVFSQVDLAEVEAQYSLNLTEIQDAQTQLSAAKDAVELLTQRDYAVLAAPETGWLPAIALADRKAAETLVQEHNPEINLLRQSLQVAREKVKQTEANTSARLDLVAEHSGQATAGEHLNQYNAFDNSVGAEFKMNFDTNDALLFESRSMHQKQIAAELALALAIKNNLQYTQNLYSRLTDNLKQMPLQKNAIEASQKAVELTGQGFAAGMRSADDYYAAIKRLSKARVAYEYTIYDYMLDTLQLKSNAGLLSEQDLQAFSQHMR
jgi:outer membrane protein